MTESAFWKKSWKTLDPGRVSEYVKHFDYAPDEFIRLIQKRGFVNVCDAGCGCGTYSLKLTVHGFSVSGFDISEDAVGIAKELLSRKGYPGVEFCVADILSTGYADGRFDAVVARDVIDHMPIREGKAAVAELLRIVRPGGCVFLTLDKTDEEYEAEPHEVSDDGDYLYTDGKWEGMAFHPYSPEEIEKLTLGFFVTWLTATATGFSVVLERHEKRMAGRA